MYVIVCAYVRIIRSIQMCGEALAQGVDWARLFQQRHDGCTMFNCVVFRRRFNQLYQPNWQPPVYCDPIAEICIIFIEYEYLLHLVKCSMTK